MGSLWQDLRYGLRTLAKSPSFTVVAVLTLALGIGANTAMFSVLDGVLLAPLPYHEPDRLVLVWLNNLRLKNLTDLSYPDFLDWQREARSFQEMAAFNYQNYDLTSPGTPAHLDGREISSGFFTTLGVQLALGRVFSREEDRPGGPPAVIISNRLWRNRFGRSQAVLGKSVTLGGTDYSIVGVLPRGFSFGTYPAHADIYTPLGQSDPLLLNDRTIHDIGCLARLNPGVSIGQAHAEMNTLQARIGQLYPAQEQGLETKVVPLKEQIVGNVSRTILLLFGAVGLVLLIAAANVANLLLARATVRAREFVIRASLGASRARLVRQLLTENILLSLAGGGLGLLMAVWGIRPVLAVVPGGLPRMGNIGLNVPVLLFALGVSLGVGILFGFAPALRYWKADLQEALKEGGRTSSTGRRGVQSSLVVFEMALTLVLLAAAGLLLRTIRRLWDVNPGFDAQHLITFKVGIAPSLTKTPSSTRNTYQQLLERIRSIPGVQAADITALVPLAGLDNSGPFLVGPERPSSIAEAPRALFYWTGPDYLRTMKIPLLRGRFLTPEDTAKTEPVVVIDSVLARNYFPQKDPVGRTMTIPHWSAVRIVGVVGHVRHWGLATASTWTRNQIYCSLYQLPSELVPVFYRDVAVIVRTPLDLAALMPLIKNAVSGTNRSQPVYDVQSIQEIMARSMSSQRFPMILLGAFAGLALVLASVGIYGVISYSVAQRVHEIGIRVALGAERGKVLGMVVAQAARMALLGIGAGLLAAFGLTRLMASLLFGVSTHDPLTLAGVAMVLLVVALAASYIPARRATKIDPMVALRYE